MAGEIDWQARAERAEKACAEMRRAIEDVINFKCDDYYHDYCSCSSTRQEHLQRSLSSDCGSGYVRREELDATKEFAAKLMRWWASNRYNNDGFHLRYEEAKKLGIKWENIA